MVPKLNIRLRSAPSLFRAALTLSFPEHNQNILGDAATNLKICPHDIHWQSTVEGAAVPALDAISHRLVAIPVGSMRKTEANV